MDNIFVFCRIEAKSRKNAIQNVEIRYKTCNFSKINVAATT